LSGFRYTNPCKECNRKRSTERLCKLTKEQKREAWNNWRNSNKEYVNECGREYRKNNPETIRKINKRYKESKKHNIQFKISESLRKKTNYYLIKNRNYNMKINLFGENTEFVVKWIEFQFTSEMNWENYGIYWEFDHIKPMDSFDLSNKIERYKCSHWSNLQPIKKEENASKKNKIFAEIIDAKKEQAIKFLSVPLKVVSVLSTVQ
jgi:hypothetical protein